MSAPIPTIVEPTANPNQDGKQAFMSKYEVVGRLGEGHFGTVYEVSERADGTRWAAKVINKEKCTAKAFEDEIFIMKKINHKHAVALRETFDSRDYYILILELLTGGELFDRILDIGVFNEQEAAKFFRESLSVVKHLHDQMIVHRDLKPENIMLLSKDPPPMLKIGDFGLSRVVSTDKYLIEVAGTPNYMAPEIFLRKPYGRPVDMWAMGVVLYVTLSGLFPYEWKDKRFVFDFPSPEFDNISPSAKEVIGMMLDKNPDTRITVDQALRHPWVTGRTATYLEIPTKGLAEFNARRRFKRAGDTIRSALRLKGIAAGAIKLKLSESLARKATFRDRLSTLEEDVAKEKDSLESLAAKMKELMSAEKTDEDKATDAHGTLQRIQTLCAEIQGFAKKIQEVTTEANK